MQELIEAYEKGAHEDAWRRISSIDRRHLDAREQKTLRDFTGRVVSRIVESIRELKSRLLSEGFVFEDEDRAILEPNKLTKQQYHAVVREIGRPPLVLECFYEHLHAVNFSQGRTQLNDSSSCFFQSQFYISLIVAPPDHASYRWNETKRISQDPIFLESVGRTAPTPVERFVETGPVLSSGEPVGFSVPSHMVDAKYYVDLVTKREVTFLEEMRRAVEMAGFGGLRGHPPSHPLRRRMSAIGNGLVRF